MFRALAFSSFVILLAGCFFTNPPREEEPSSNDSSTTLASYRAGRAKLDLAVEALGGTDALSSFSDLGFDYRGTALSRGQSKVPSGPYYERPVEGHFLYDATGRVLHEHKTLFLGGRTFAYTRFSDGNEGWTYRTPIDEISDLTPFDIGFLQNIPQQHAPWTIPHSLVSAALANPSSIRLESQPSSPDEVRVSFSTSTGTSRTLVLNRASGLPERVQFLRSDPLIGDVQSEVRYSDYREVAGIRIPHRLLFVTAGEELEQWTLSDVVVNQRPDDNLFGRPEAVEIALPKSFQPERVADGVYAVTLFAGMSFTYNSMIVVSDEYVTVIEAPLSDFFFPVMKGIAAKVAPGRPIQNVVSTHHHFDHVGGLKAYLAAGITVHTGAENAKQIEMLASADHTLQPNPLAGRTGAEPLSIKVVDGKEILKSGSREIQLIDVGPNPHADQMLVAWIPDAGVMYVADLFASFESGNFDPAPAMLLEFADKLNELGIRPDAFVPAHGPVATWSDFQRAIANRPISTAGSDD